MDTSLQRQIVTELSFTRTHHPHDSQQEKNRAHSPAPRLDTKPEDAMILTGNTLLLCRKSAIEK